MSSTVSGMSSVSHEEAAQATRGEAKRVSAEAAAQKAAVEQRERKIAQMPRSPKKELHLQEVKIERLQVCP